MSYLLLSTAISERDTSSGYRELSERVAVRGALRESDCAALVYAVVREIQLDERRVVRQRESDGRCAAI